MTQALVTIALRGGVSGTAAAVVGILAGPVEPGDGFAVLPRGYRNRGEQLRVGSVQQPRQHQGMDGKRTEAKPALPARGRGIELRKHRERV